MQRSGQPRIKTDQGGSRHRYGLPPLRVAGFGVGDSRETGSVRHNAPRQCWLPVVGGVGAEDTKEPLSGRFCFLANHTSTWTEAESFGTNGFLPLRKFQAHLGGCMSLLHVSVPRSCTLGVQREKRQGVSGCHCAPVMTPTRSETLDRGPMDPAGTSLVILTCILPKS